MPRMLIVEDNKQEVESVSVILRMSWPDCQIEVAEKSSTALLLVAQGGISLVMLGLSDPSHKGLSVCREIRKQSNVPIIVLSSTDSANDRISSFRMGADDYLARPFDHIELVMRLRALARRYAQNSGVRMDLQTEGGGKLKIADLTIDMERRQVLRNGMAIKLTSIEYRLLEELVRNPGSVIPTRLLLERVWGPQYTDAPHYLKVFVHRLRRKLGEGRNGPRYIQNEWGVGYRFAAN